MRRGLASLCDMHATIKGYGGPMINLKIDLSAVSSEVRLQRDSLLTRTVEKLANRVCRECLITNCFLLDIQVLDIQVNKKARRCWLWYLPTVDVFGCAQTQIRMSWQLIQRHIKPFPHLLFRTLSKAKISGVSHHHHHSSFHIAS